MARAMLESPTKETDGQDGGILRQDHAAGGVEQDEHNRHDKGHQAGKGAGQVLVIVDGRGSLVLFLRFFVPECIVAFGLLRK